MDAIRHDVIRETNNHIEMLGSRANQLDVRCGLVTFNSEVNEPTFWGEPVTALKPLTRDNYQPYGMTALHDAIGTTIARIQEDAWARDPDCAILMLTLTDGAENSSKKYNAPWIREQIEMLQKEGKWTFTFEGANIDATKVSSKLGIPMANTIQFTASSAGIQAASDHRTVNTSTFLNTYQSGGQGALAGRGFYSQVDNQVVNLTITHETAGSPEPKTTTGT